MTHTAPPRRADVSAWPTGYDPNARPEPQHDDARGVHLPEAPARPREARAGRSPALVAGYCCLAVGAVCLLVGLTAIYGRGAAYVLTGAALLVCAAVLWRGGRR